MGAVLGQDLPSLDYPARLAALQARGVALWDVVRSARRAGSLDAAIRDHQPNPLAELAYSLPRLRALAFNGAKAAQLGRKVLAGEGAWTLIDLPSSSPAHAAVPFAAKLAMWRALAPFVEGARGA
jgi:hypoxanthine-DNA glycosylase